MKILEKSQKIGEIEEIKGKIDKFERLKENERGLIRTKRKSKIKQRN